MLRLLTVIKAEKNYVQLAKAVINLFLDGWVGGWVGWWMDGWNKKSFDGLITAITNHLLSNPLLSP